jgi:hypothetical protein
MIRLFLLVLLLFVCGFLVVVFISHKGWTLSIIAFLITAVAMLVKRNIFEGTDSESRMSLAWLRRLRRYTRVTLPILGLLVLGSLVAVFSQPGVCATDNLPLVARREHYLLVSHSFYTEVNAWRYYLAGFGFVIGWHGVALLGIVEAFGQHFQKEIYRREDSERKTGAA